MPLRVKNRAYSVPWTPSDEGLMLKMSSFESLYGGQFTLSTQSIKPNYLSSSLVALTPQQDKAIIQKNYTAKKIAWLSL